MKYTKGDDVNLIEVVCAILIKDDKIYCTQRPKGNLLEYMWEFPGGKVEVDETYEQALVREVKEELNCEIKIIDFLATSYYEYDFGNINLHAYICEVISGVPTIIEHENEVWISIENIDSLKWAPADIPLLVQLEKYINRK